MVTVVDAKVPRTKRLVPFASRARAVQASSPVPPYLEAWQDTDAAAEALSL
jgi:hypothetical protein